jgi:undecaprenyl-diphosphatase
VLTVLELVIDSAKLGLSITFVYLALHLYAQRSDAAWVAPLMRRRVSVLLAIALTATGIKIFQDVLGKESGLFDETLLSFIRQGVPTSLTGFFSLVTATGSLEFLFTLATLTTLVLLLAKRWFDSLLVAVAPTIASLLVLGIKILVGRERPLQGVAQYSDSSFPSGHTVGVAAFATAVALVSIHTWPKSRVVVSSVATAWIILVALSRLVLGVHWPTDVLAAACLGAVIPLAISLLRSNG